MENVIDKASAQSKSYNWFEMSATDIEKNGYACFYFTVPTLKPLTIC